MPETYGYTMVEPEASDNVQHPGHKLRLKDLEKPPAELFVLGTEIVALIMSCTTQMITKFGLSVKSLPTCPTGIFHRRFTVS